MRKIFALGLAEVLASPVFAAEAPQFGWQNGAVEQVERGSFFSGAGKFATEAEREAAFRAAQIGGDGPNSDQIHFDVEALVSRGVVSQEQADKIKADASKKHEGIDSKYASADRSEMSRSQLAGFYRSLAQ